jgi:CDGSH-type Zn-finger protein
MAHDTPQITVQTDGPYLVHGDVALTRRRIVKSENDESMTWETTERFPAIEKAAALCRCGGSSNKPFCDGTHRKNGFDGTPTAPTTAYDERAKTLGGDERIVVRDDRGICVHAGFCGNKVTNVWNMAGGGGPEDSVTRAAMMGMIERCPSGALSYQLDDGTDLEPELAAQVAAVEDGPLFVTGGVTVQLADGTTYESRNRVTLCRCGHSKNKPLCDGSHADISFRDPS